MQGSLTIAGEQLTVACSVPWLANVIAAEADLRAFDALQSSVRVEIESARHAFETQGWDRIARGTWHRGGEIVVEDACRAGFDLHVRCSSTCAEFTYRWRPTRRQRVAAAAFRSRFHAVARAALIEYPALWRAGHRNRAPLHAFAWCNGDSTPLVVASGAVGSLELGSGGCVTGHNLAASDGSTVWGLGERFPVTGEPEHDVSMPGRADALTPDSVVVLMRGASSTPSLEPCSPGTAARALVATTYAASELRRYWSLAAVLSRATGVGPTHPPVVATAGAFALNLPGFSIALGKGAGALSTLLRELPRGAFT